jgi:hypothetical protein
VAFLVKVVFGMARKQLKHRILVATASRWFPTARLAMALSNAGCTIEAVCPSNHPLSLTSALHRTYRYHGLAPIRSLRAAIVATRPDLIIPGDDLAVQHLHCLYFQEQRKGKEGAVICALIERSLGAPESFPLVYTRTALMELADEEGVRVPKTAVITDSEDLKKSIAQIGFPMVLKADRSSGGKGVRIVRTFEEAERALRRLQAPPLLARAAKHALFDRDTTLVWPSLLRRRNTVNAQAFVAGREATSAVVCWNGTVLAGLHFEVINKNDSSGPATVLRLIENADMAAAAEKIARRLSLSGLHGFDFMLEAGTGNAHLVEINPRSTQVGHLTLGPGRDLPAALHAALSGEPLQEAPKVTEKTTIALFPQEWLRDPTSTFLKSGYHDVPWEERALVGAGIRKRLNRSAWDSLQHWIQGFSSEAPDQIESLLETKRLVEPPISLP